MSQNLPAGLRYQIHPKLSILVAKNGILADQIFLRNNCLTVRGLWSSRQSCRRLWRLNLSVGPSGLWFDELGS